MTLQYFLHMLNTCGMLLAKFRFHGVRSKTWLYDTPNVGKFFPLRQGFVACVVACDSLRCLCSCNVFLDRLAPLLLFAKLVFHAAQRCTKLLDPLLCLLIKFKVIRIENNHGIHLECVYTLKYVLYNLSQIV